MTEVRPRDDADIGQRRVGVGARGRVAVAQQIGLEQVALGLGVALETVERRRCPWWRSRQWIWRVRSVGAAMFEVALDLGFGFERIGDAAALAGDLLFDLGDLCRSALMVG